MIGRTAMIGLVLVTAAVVQTSLLPFLTLGGYRPDLLLLITIAFALHDGITSGLRTGFAAGVLTDLLLSSSPVGLTALVFLGIAWTVGIAKPYLASDSWTAPVLLSVMGTAVGVAAYGLLSAVLAEDPIAADLVIQASVVSALYAALLAPIVMGLVRRLAAQFPAEQAGIV